MPRLRREYPGQCRVDAQRDEGAEEVEREAWSVKRPRPKPAACRAGPQSSPLAPREGVVHGNQPRGARRPF
jgi:hypothetical protein